MKKVPVIIILFFISIWGVQSLPAQNTWVQKSNFPGGVRFGAIAFSIGGKGYVGLGNNGAGITYKDLWEYNPTLDTWVQKSDFPSISGRTGAVSFSINNKGYVGTGSDTAIMNDFWEYDPLLDLWTQKANIDSIGREGAIGFSIGSKGYIGIGVTAAFPGNYLKDFWEYDPFIDTWTRKADFGGIARGYASCFGIGGKGYVGLGAVDLPGAGAFNGEFWEYDTLTDTWTQKGYLPAYVRHSAIGFAIGNKGYFGTGYFGYMGNYYLNDFWEYNPLTEDWVQASNFGGLGRLMSIGFSISNNAYVGLGTGSSSLLFDDLWEYTPDSALFLKSFKNFNDNFIVFPNPSVGDFKILNTKTEYSPVKIQILNVLGEKIIESKELLTEEMSFDFSHEQNGLYLIIIDDGNKVITKKIIINH